MMRDGGLTVNEWGSGARERRKDEPMARWVSSVVPTGWVEGWESSMERQWHEPDVGRQPGFPDPGDHGARPVAPAQSPHDIVHDATGDVPEAPVILAWHEDYDQLTWEPGTGQPVTAFELFLALPGSKPVLVRSVPADRNSYAFAEDDYSLFDTRATEDPDADLAQARWSYGVAARTPDGRSAVAWIKGGLINLF
jgi:hypothetical protein